MIRRLTIKNFLALSALSIDVDERGALIEGGNGKGKTTVLKAIKAALEGAGISPEAVRKGESAAEILIDLDDDTVRRRITAAGKTELEIEDAMGAPRKKPVAFLSALLDLVLLDPLDLFLEKDAKERRAMVVRAVPCTATPAMLQPYLPPWYDALTDNDCKGHGLDVVELLRGNIAGARTSTGRDLKTKKQERDAAVARAAELQKALAPMAGRPSKASAAQRLFDATTARATITSRAESAARTTTYVDGQRKRAAALREQASAALQTAPRAPTAEERDAALEALGQAREARDQAEAALSKQQGVVAELERQLRVAREEEHRLDAAAEAAGRAVAEKDKAAAAIEQREADAHAAAERSQKLEEDAAEVLSAIAELAAEPPSDVERAAAETEYSAAEQAVRDADEAERARQVHADAVAEAEAKKAAHDLVAERHAALDKSAKALANEVPRELLAGAAGLTGLTMEGDTILVDDGTGTLVDVERLSTAAQMKFALEVAKRLNTRSKILLVDGLERLDPEHRGAFVQLAIADGYQLFATRVTSGPLSVAPITDEAT